MYSNSVWEGSSLELSSSIPRSGSERRFEGRVTPIDPVLASCRRRLCLIFNGLSSMMMRYLVQGAVKLYRDFF